MGILELTPEEKQFLNHYKLEVSVTAVGGALGYVALATESAPVMAGSLGALGLAIVSGGIRSWRETNREAVDEIDPPD